MECQPYITVDEFKQSPYFCHFPDCCIPSGMVIDDVINGYILEAQVIINSYIGWEVCILPRKDVFKGDDSKTYISDYYPVVEPSGYVLQYKAIDYFSNLNAVLSQTRTLLSDGRSGLFRIYPYFKQNYEYYLDYFAGYEVIPDEIKTAMKMLVLNLAQRLDNGNLSNPDFSIDRISVDKSATFQFGSSKMIKNVIVRNVDELSDLPTPIKKLLDRFKHNKMS